MGESKSIEMKILIL